MLEKPFGQLKTWHALALVTLAAAAGIYVYTWLLNYSARMQQAARRQNAA